MARAFCAAQIIASSPQAISRVCNAPEPRVLCREMVAKYGIKHFYDITDRSNFKANPDYKGVCHIAMAEEGHCKPGQPQAEPPERQARNVIGRPWCG